MRSRSSIILPLLSIFVVFTLSLHGQEAEKASVGIDLFKKGDYAGAVKALKDTKEPVELTYLGIAYEKLGKMSDAGKAFDESFVQVLAHIGAILLPKDASPETADRKGLGEAVLKAAADPIKFALATAAKIQELKTGYSKRAGFKNSVLLLGELDKLLKNGETIYTDAELDTKLNITRKSWPTYTDSAREAGTSGTVVMLVLFKKDGTHISAPVVLLPNGLTESAMDAAHDTKFKPAKKDGKPVNVLKKVEYSFYIE